MYQAIGSQLSCILVDNGLLRKDEEMAVINEFSKHFKTDLHVVAAEDRFLRRFGMQPADANDDGDAAGPGWYESSRELQTGLLVLECPVGEALYA